MKLPNLTLALLASSLPSVSAANPFGVFDFNLRGKDPAEQIKSLDGIDYDGITLPLKTPKDLEKNSKPIKRRRPSGSADEYP